MMENNVEFVADFGTLCNMFTDFITDFIPAMCSCPAFIFIGALCGCIGIVKLAWYLADC